MSSCCDNETGIEKLRKTQSGTLKLVLIINALMFVVVLMGGLYASSAALVSDSLDNFGDALTYGLSLYAVYQNSHTKARVALFKGALILLAALLVLAQVIYRLIVPTVPVFELMGVISLVALAANGTCLALLTRHKAEDVNMSSVWECSRNDIVANISVFLAAGAVWLTHSPWPDLIIALGLVALFLRSAFRVFANATHELQTAT
jgi:Co/Zn/Cd efflux system component